MFSKVMLSAGQPLLNAVYHNGEMHISENGDSTELIHPLRDARGYLFSHHVMLHSH